MSRPIIIKSVSTHCSNRIKQRVGIKTQSARKKFIRRVAKYGLPLNKIPKDAFLSFLKTVKKYLYKGNQSWSEVILYLDYIVVVSSDGIAVTVLNIDKRYNGIFGKIQQYIQDSEKNTAPLHSNKS